jgi:L-fuconolactonase
MMAADTIEGAAARPTRILDSHVHFWTIGGPGQSWPDADWPRLHRDFLPRDLRDAAKETGLIGAILVQSQPDDRDTDWMIALADEDPLVLGIVGWAALDAAGAPERIAALASRPKLVGLRPMLQGIAETDWLLRPALTPAIAAMIEHGLRFDALIEPRHLPMLARFADRWPDLPIVVDHGAKPRANVAELDPWREQLAALAAHPNVWCKLSGLRTEQAPGQSADALAPYADHIVETFGPRAMWGSDWPVILHAGDGYGDWLATAQRLVAPRAPAILDRLFEGAAREFYGLDAE